MKLISTAALYVCLLAFGASAQTVPVSPLPKESLNFDRLRMLDELNRPTASFSASTNPKTPTNTVSLFALQHKTPPEAWAAYVKAAKYRKQGDSTRSLAQLEKAVSIDPEFYDAQDEMGVEYEEAGRSDLAAKQFTLLTRLDPTNPTGYVNLGVIKLKNHQYEEAEALGRRAVQIDPRLPEADILLGITLLVSGKDQHEAQKWLAAASRSLPDAGELLKAIGNE